MPLTSSEGAQGGRFKLELLFNSSRSPSAASELAPVLASECVALMEATPKVTQLLVVDAQDHLVGALHIHDLFRARVV